MDFSQDDAANNRNENILQAFVFEEIKDVDQEENEQVNKNFLSSLHLECGVKKKLVNRVYL